MYEMSSHTCTSRDRQTDRRQSRHELQ
jgi:hypothetical protein